MSFPGRPHKSITLIAIADSGSTLDLNDRQRESGESRIDLLKVPSSIEKEIQTSSPGAAINFPHEARILYNLGSTSATKFIERIETEWTVQTLPLGMCRYERGATGSTNSAPFRVRFHAPIAYALGHLAAKHGNAEKGGDTRDHLVVTIVSDDPQLIPAISEARQAGLDARLVWFEGVLSPEVSYFCARNEVPVVLIDAIPVSDASDGAASRSRVSALGSLNGLLDAKPRSADSATRRR